MTGQAARGGLWLPPLGELVIDARSWEYASEPSGPSGFARLRVWDSPLEAGCFAIVTESGLGLSVTNAAAAIYRRLIAEFGEPMGLAELWPDGHSGPAHLDLVLPAPERPHGVDWLRLWPTGTGGAVSGWDPAIARMWVSVNAADIFAP